MVDAIGIDAGSYKTVLACVKQRGIEIVLSETSAKWTPTIAGYTDQERLIGDAAINQMKKNFKNTMQFFGRFMGLNQDCQEQIEEEKKFVTYKVVNMENKKIGFEVMLRGQKRQLTPEQVMGFYLKKARTYFEQAGMKSKEIVLSVPSYATNAERQAYLDAAEIAGIKCIRLINESTATALTYGFFRKNDLEEKKPRKVVFVDFGHSKLTCTFAQFLKGKMKILYTFSNRNLGARQIDYQLFDLLAAEFEKKYGCDPRQSPRARLRLLDSIEKMRKLLTSNKESDINCEALLEDEDLRRHFTRDELETLIEPSMIKFRETLEEALKASGLQKEEIDFVELVGEATRIPIAQKHISETFGKELSRTLNSTDCIARGCALQAAFLSPNFQVAQFQVEEFNNEPVSISYKFKGTEKVVTKELFKNGSSFPSTKSITFDNKNGSLDLMVHYSDSAQLMSGLPNQISQYGIEKAKVDDKTEKYSFTMRVSNNIHNIACLDEVEFVQEWTEQEKIPVKASPITATPPPKKEEEKKDSEPKEGEKETQNQESAKSAPESEQPKAEVIQPEQQYEIKEKKKKNYSQIKFGTSSYALAPTQRRDFTELENQFSSEDADILDQKFLKNTLEAYSYDMRNNLDSYGSFEKYLDEATKTSFMAEIGQVVDWIYGDGENAPKAEFQTKLEKFRAIGEPVKQRHFYHSELPVYFSQIEDLSKKIAEKASTIEHITEEQKDLINKKIEAAKEFFAKVEADRAKKQLYENPDFNLEQIISTLSLLKSECDSIFANVKPPKMEEPKKDEPMENTEKPKEDAEMKNEEEQPKEAEKPAEAEEKTS